MSANENRATKAKHIHYQMSSVDHCHREDVPRRHSGGTVRILFFSLSVLVMHNFQQSQLGLLSSQHVEF